VGAQLALIIGAVAQFYGVLIIIYVLMSWFPTNGALYDAYRVLGSLVDPYLNIFRRFIPPIGGLDLSPIAAFIVLQIVVNSVLVPLALRL
jgi:YggT family protein